MLYLNFHPVGECVITRHTRLDDRVYEHWTAVWSLDLGRLTVPVMVLYLTEFTGNARRVGPFLRLYGRWFWVVAQDTSLCRFLLVWWPWIPLWVPWVLWRTGILCLRRGWRRLTRKPLTWSAILREVGPLTVNQVRIAHGLAPIPDRDGDAIRVDVEYFRVPTEVFPDDVGEIEEERDDVAVFLDLARSNRKEDFVTLARALGIGTHSIIDGSPHTPEEQIMAIETFWNGLVRRLAPRRQEA